MAEITMDSSITALSFLASKSELLRVLTIIFVVQLISHPRLLLDQQALVMIRMTHCLSLVLKNLLDE